MKFTKLTSAALTAGTILSILAPTATFAQTAEHDANANGGTELPMPDNTEVGISFGDNTNNGNTGYLRLQMVPHVLDFGNHTEFLSQYPTFDATGHNVSIDSNDRHASYKNTDTNLTATLNTEDPELSKVKGKAWATVVDKQITRENNTEPNTKQSGTWQLKVKSDDVLTSTNNGETINNANLLLKNTAYGRTLDVPKLTNEAQDSDFQADSSIDDADVSTIAKNVSLSLDGNSPEVEVANAADTEGQGANVFGWDRSDINLTLPKDSKVGNDIYTAHLTWTLYTGVQA
ncbi:WxL domain-containing protein [Latilactobacillus curvatus]|uniref:Cell surface protein n=1 Tax=Latilactobacillus curvatus TaxID=28038 RepID=A0AAC9UT67_LATCU|nr:WxL domain-containing protein [Latilactobacillus curvatus]ASN60892.1 cell surface protein [Latilactobacillus curvatus]MDG2979330.1 WxL domain-containing protein [Latilactobacillus curvatus]